MKAPVAGTIRGREDRDLPLELEDASIDIGFSQEEAGIINEVPSGKVVSSIYDDIVGGK